MRIASAMVVCLGCCAALAQGECKKERALSKPEQAFFAKAKGLAKLVPAAPAGWEQHPEEVAAPAKLCTDVDPMFKKGQARLNLVSETEYRDPTDRSAKKDAALKAGEPTADETRKSAELAKKLNRTDGGATLQAGLAEQQKLLQAQLDRGNKAMHEAGRDGEARVRVSFNPEMQSSTGCGYQLTVAALKVDGAPQAFAGTCEVMSNPQEPEGGVLLLFGTWAAKAEGSTLEASPTYDAKKAHTVVQAMSVLITGDNKRPEELLKSVDVKALAALVGK